MGDALRNLILALWSVSLVLFHKSDWRIVGNKMIVVDGSGNQLASFDLVAKDGG